MSTGYIAVSALDHQLDPVAPITVWHTEQEAFDDGASNLRPGGFLIWRVDTSRIEPEGPGAAWA